MLMTSPVYGSPKPMTHPAQFPASNQQLPNHSYRPGVTTQTPSTYVSSPAEQYIAATHAAAAQGGIPGAVPGAQVPTQSYPAQPGMGGVQIQGAPLSPTSGIGSHSYPGASGQQYGPGHAPGQYSGYDHHSSDHLPGHYHHRRKKKSRLRKMLEELLVGTTGAAASDYLARRRRERRSQSEASGTTRPETPPKGSALGYLHPEGHFVPAALDAMINHFLHRKTDKKLAPEGSKPGYLHTRGNFVPMSMEWLIDEFKHTLLWPGEGRRHHRRSREGDRSSASSDSDDSDDSDQSTESEDEHSRHGKHRRHNDRRA